MSQHALQTLLAPSSAIVLTGQDPTDPILITLLQALSKTNKELTLVGVIPEWDAKQLCVNHYASCHQLNKPYDVAIFAGKTNQPMRDIIADCGRAGIHSLLMLSWTGEDVNEIQHYLRLYNVRLLGPNSFGICRPKKGFSAWLGLTHPLPGRLALMSQSGTVASALVDWASWQGIGFSQVVAMGSPVDVMPSQILDFLSNDFESQAILMYLQSVGQPTRFLSSLRAASRSKPVAVVTEHNLGADPRVLDAALMRTGAVRGRRLNDLIGAASVMTNARRIKEGSLMIIGNGAGPGELAAQRAAELNLSLLKPDPVLREQLENIVSQRGHIGPVSTVWASCPSNVFVDLAHTTLNSQSCGAVLLMLSPTALIDLSSFCEQVTALHRKQKKLIMVCLLGGGDIIAMRTRLNEAGIPTFRTPETAIEGFQFLEQFQRNQQLAKQSPDSNAASQQLNIEQARKHLKTFIRQGKTQLSAIDFAPVLALFNLSFANFPRSQSVINAALHVRIFRDPVFGTAIGVALGGSDQGSPQKSEVVGLPPLNTLLARDLISQLLPPGNYPHIEALLLNVSSLACELPECQTLQLSKLYIDQYDCLNGDIDIRLAPCTNKRRYDHLAIQPYPRHWVSHVTLRDGSQTTVRPVRPEDSPLIADFVRGMSKETRYLRFISNIEELTPRMLSTMSHIDYDREMAFMAVHNVDGKDRLIGTSRYIDNFDDQSCEFAVVLDDDFQGLGLASYLMKQLFLAAADKGIRVMQGIVLAENKRMITFCKHLGFGIQRDPDDISQVIATVALNKQFIDSLGSKKQ
ncbi:GNAT family N-acetyltransferase [Marinomonas pollencensis]|uniref:Acetyltransferase n=1 Tax=Marinomonas pollencensis TaxID=491954 RepID=A0A3E0DPX5_9GAMM|nr:GNAT family N-acetyltransferase [Marinomonas pollencensis]REG84980.1 acetyltransferase [Marinomonas pollencensis]